MADHIERVIVEGEVKLDTSEAEKKKENLKKPIEIKLDANAQVIFNNIIRGLNALQAKINQLDFKKLEQHLSKSISNGSKEGIKEVEKQAKLLNNLFNETLWKSKTKDGNEISHSFSTAMRDIRKEMLAISKTLKSFNTAASDSISIKISADNLEQMSTKILEAQKSLTKFQGVIKQIDSISLSSGISKQLSDIDSLVNSLNKNFNNLEKTMDNIANFDIGKIDNKRKKVSEKKVSTPEDEAEKQAKRAKNIQETYEKINKLNQRMSNYTLSGEKFKGANAYQRILPDIEKVKSALQELNTEIKKDSADIDLSKIEKSMNEIAPSVKKVDKAFEQLNQSITQFEANKNANTSLNWLDKNTRAVKKYGDEVKRIAELQRTELSKGAQESLAKQLNSVKSSAAREGLIGKSWTDSFKQGLGSFSQIFGSFSLMNRADDIAHDMVRTIHDVDDALTDLKMATGVSNSEAESLMETYSKMGKNLKATGVDVAKSSTEWLKQGKSIKEAEQLATDSTVLAKIGDLTSEQSTKYLTSAMKGFKVDAKDALNIVDKLSAVDMVSATDVGGLAEGMSEVAASADLAGVSMDKLLSYLAVVGETTQEGMSSVGNSFNAIFARMGNIKLGRLKDYQNSGEDLSDVETVLKGQGIALRDENKQFKNFGEVLDEVAGNWKNYSSVSQRAIAKAFAGTHHMNSFIVLMENYQTAMKYMQESTESSGFALEKFGAYQDSLTGKIEGFKNSFQTLSNTIIGSGFLKGIVDIGTTSLDTLDAIIEKLEVIPSLLTGFGIYQGFKGGG